MEASGLRGVDVSRIITPPNNIIEQKNKKRERCVFFGDFALCEPLGKHAS